MRADDGDLDRPRARTTAGAADAARPVAPIGAPEIAWARAAIVAIMPSRPRWAIRVRLDGRPSLRMPEG